MPDDNSFKPFQINKVEKTKATCAIRISSFWEVCPRGNCNFTTAFVHVVGTLRRVHQWSKSQKPEGLVGKIHSNQFLVTSGVIASCVTVAFEFPLRSYTIMILYTSQAGTQNRQEAI